MTFLGQEGAQALEYRWCPLDELPAFQPHYLTSRLTNLPEATEHLFIQPRYPSPNVGQAILPAAAFQAAPSTATAGAVETRAA